MKFATGLTLMLLGVIGIALSVSLAITLVPIWLLAGFTFSSMVASGFWFLLMLAMFWVGALLTKQGWQS